MTQLIFKLTAQIKEMETQMDKLVKEKETVKETDAPNIPTVIPVITTAVVSTLGEKLAPNEPLATTVPVHSATTSATDSSKTQVQQTDGAGQIVKAMEELSLKTNEINSLQNMIQSIEATNKTTLIIAKNHEQKAIRLEEQMKNLQKELTFTEQISFIKNHLWTNIIEAIHSQWPSIQVIYEQRYSLLATQTKFQRTKDELADKPSQALKLITFLNSKKIT